MARQRASGGRRSAQREQAWRQMVAGQAGSGLSVARFCRERGITAGSFYFWRRELSRREAEQRAVSRSAMKSASPTMSFVEVGVTNASSGDDRREHKAIPIVIQLGWARVEVPGGFDRETLAQVLTILHEQVAPRGAAC